MLSASRVRRSGARVSAAADGPHELRAHDQRVRGDILDLLPLARERDADWTIVRLSDGRELARGVPPFRLWPATPRGAS
jgi:hypothetical protein